MCPKIQHTVVLAKLHHCELNLSILSIVIFPQKAFSETASEPLVIFVKH